MTQLTNRRLAWLPLAALPLVFAACAKDGADAARAQSPGAADSVADSVAEESPAKAPSAVHFTAEDTATRKVANALSKYDPAADSAAADSTAPKVKYNAGEDPKFAARMGWPVNGPKPLPGAILPEKRILCYYGHPGSTRMGVLGEYPKDQMLAKLDAEVKKWNAADPEHPVQPCLHLVAVVAQSEPGRSGKYRTISSDSLVNRVYSWAKERNGIFFVDIQVGHDDIRNILPRFEWILKNPDVHLAIDPEFMLTPSHKPGAKIGTMPAADINYASAELARIVREHNLPPKVFVVHRFTRNMVTGTRDILLRPEVQIVMDMDGWGAPWLKRDSYRDYIVREPVQFTGFKLFYHNDTKKGDPLMQPADLLKLHPKPLYIQYQ